MNWKSLLWPSLLVLIIVFSRLPFLAAGFGADEDAWQVANNARQIIQNHTYSVSRFPGNPLQDLLFLSKWNQSAFSFNLISTLFCVLASLALYKCVLLSNARKAFYPALSLAFLPVIYIASTNSMDYVPALACICWALYFALSGNIIACGVLIGLATGFRISSLGVLLPMAMLLYKRKKLSAVLTLAFSAILVSIICFLPVFLSYQFQFLQYYQPAVLAGVFKIIYKGTIGVFGVLGMLATIYFSWKILSKTKKLNIWADRYNYACLAAIAVFGAAYLWLPQESAYLIPILPFALLFLARYLSEKENMVFCGLIVLSSFCFGISKKDLYAGPNESALAIPLQIENQGLILDPLFGPIVQDNQKRKNRMLFCRRVLARAKSQTTPSVLIAGNWWTELVYELKGNKLGNVICEYYLSPVQIANYERQAYQIQYLPDQDFYNIKRYHNSQSLLRATAFIK